MGRTINIQTNFSVGELDPLLRGRVDLQQYYNCVSSAKNVFIQPQGGIKRRGGLKFVSEIPSSANPQNGIRLFSFEFNVDDSYIFAVLNQRIYIFRNQALVTNINGTGNDYLAVTQITSAMLPKLKFTQSADTAIFVQEDLPPLKIVRGDDHNLWTVSTITFDKEPYHAFSLTLREPSGTLTPSATSGSVELTAGSSIFHEGRSNTAQAGGSDTITLDTGAVATDDIYNGSTIKITGGIGSGQIRVISDYVGATKVATVSEAWDTQPDNTSTFSIESHVNQYVNVNTTYGRARIIEFISATKVRAVTEVDFFNTSAVSSGDYELELGYEPSWSSTRGYPISVTFYQGRLYFGGSKSLPTTFFGSNVNDFFNFNLGDALDDQAVIGTITTASLNSIVDIFAGRDFQILSSGGEFYIPQTLDDPITPENLVVRNATTNGAKPGVPVVGLDSGTIYVQRGGKSLNEMSFTDTEQAYNTASLTLLSSHLLNTPTDLAIRRSTSTEETDRLFLVNSGNGEMIVFSLLRSQNVIAPSRIITSGNFLAVSIDVDTTYVAIKRTINSADKYYIEVFDEDLHTDSAVTGTGSNASATASHLPSTLIDILNDGIVEAQQTTNGSGQVTFARASTSSYEIGIPYDIEIKTMPVQIQGGSSVSMKGVKKRILEVNADLFQTQAMSINDQVVAFRSFGEDVLDSSVVPYTGIKTIGPLLGFDYLGEITITQSVPLDFNLLALDYKISVGG